MKTTPTCATCPFWDYSDSQTDGRGNALKAASGRNLHPETYPNYGLCRVDPPQKARGWVTTKRLDYCGQHPDFHVVNVPASEASAIDEEIERIESSIASGARRTKHRFKL